MSQVQNEAGAREALPRVRPGVTGGLVFIDDDPGVPADALHDPFGGLDERTVADACRIMEAKEIGAASLAGNVLQRDIPLRSVPRSQRRRALSAGGNNAGRSLDRIRARARRDLGAVLEGLAAGSVTLRQAQEQTAPLWRSFYEDVRDVGRRASGLDRIGGDPTVYREEEVWFRRAVREEVGYWNTFLAQVAAGNVTEERREQRFDAYLDAMRFMYESTRVASLPDDVLLYWAGPEDDHRCPGCVYMQARSPLTKDTIPAVPRDGMTNCLTNCRHRIVVRIPESQGSVFRRRMELPRRAQMVRELKEIRRERSRKRAMQIALGVPPRGREPRNLRPPHQTVRASERARNPFRGTPITAPPPQVPFTRRGRRVRVTPTGFIAEATDPAKRAKKMAKIQRKAQEKEAKANQKHQERLAKIQQQTADKLRAAALGERSDPPRKGSGDIDSGATGKAFEAAFLKGLDLLKWSYRENRATGALWDLLPQGKGWHKLIKDRDVNLKVYSTRWLFSDSQTYKAAERAARMVRSGKLTPEQADDRVRRKLRSMLAKKGAAKTAFLKPRDAEVQAGIVRAVRDRDLDTLRELLQSRYWASKRFGRYKVEVEIDWTDPEWADGARLRIDGGTKGKKMGATGRVRSLGGVLTFAFRDRSGTPKRPHHAARVESADLDEWSLGTASKGIRRIDMPQIPSDRVPAFLEWLKTKHSIGHRSQRVQASSLHPSQEEFNVDKVKRYTREKKPSAERLHNFKPVLVSSDLYVLDGHHRWLEALILDPRTQVNCIVIGARIDRLLALAHAFPLTGQRKGVSKKEALEARVAGLMEKQWSGDRVRAFIRHGVAGKHGRKLDAEDRLRLLVRAEHHLQGVPDMPQWEREHLKGVLYRVRDEIRAGKTKTAPSDERGFLSWLGKLLGITERTDEEDKLEDPSLAVAVKRAGFDSVQQARDAVRGALDRKQVKRLPKRVRRKLVPPEGDDDTMVLNDEWPRPAPIAEGVSSTWDSVPYSSMRIQDVARLLDGASRKRNPDPVAVLKIINRLVGALEFGMMAAIGRPEADRTSTLIRGALDRLAQRINLGESVQRLEDLL